MRVIFAGTPAFACVALQRLYASGSTIALVLTQPDRPAGRGMKLQASAVKRFALDHQLPVAQPSSLRLDGSHPADAAAARDAIEQAGADVMVVAAYGLILPAWVLTMPRLGCLNIHASLLPRWRGAAPIHRAVEAGDTETGITIMQMDAGLDTGDMLLATSIPITPADTTGSMHDKLASLGGQLIVKALALASSGDLAPVRQPDEGVSYAHKIGKAEAQLDWAQPAELIGQRIRALDPSPGASASIGAAGIKIWQCEIDVNTDALNAAAGTVIYANQTGIGIACGLGVLRLTQLQRAGGKRLSAVEFLRGFPLLPGVVLAPA